MAQAKGILPRSDDREVLYKNPRTCGYFIGVTLDPAMDRLRLEAWLQTVSPLVDQLVARLPAKEGQDKGEKVAAVAVGLAPSFFTVSGSPRFEGAIEPPVSFSASMALPNTVPPLSAVPLVDADVMFYVASVFEARVNAFISGLAGLQPNVHRVTLERGYQRLDETEPFGYRDGVRNALPKNERPKIIFVHRAGRELDEPAWADGGSYLSYLKVRQHPDQFAALPDDATRDAVIGRTKDGTRLDLVAGDHKSHAEPADVPEALPASSHVRKTGPRGRHDDTQVFRRGLPYMETTPDGQLAVGLHFCSFQASLDQFDVIFNDWSLNRQFPQLPSGGEAGVDALLDPSRGLTLIEKAGFFFVPPYHPEGLAAAILAAPPSGRPPKTGRLVVRKRVTDPSDSSRRFERGGFVFQVLNAEGQSFGGQFTTDSTGRAVCPVELSLDQTYTLQEVSSPVPNVPLINQSFVMQHSNQQVQVLNQVTQPNTPYGG